MQTGFNNTVQNEEETEAKVVENAKSMFLVLIEDALRSATIYASATNRRKITALDIKYALRFHARTFDSNNVISRSSDALDTWNSTIGDEEDSDNDDDGEEEEFVRSTDSHSEYTDRMNHFYDTWDEWNPETTAECMLKKSIDLNA